MQLAFTVGVTLIFSAIIVYLRDVRQVLPMILQFGLFATPVGYGLEVIPERVVAAVLLRSTRWPRSSTGTGARCCSASRPGWACSPSARCLGDRPAVVGYLLFKRMETGFADVA